MALHPELAVVFRHFEDAGICWCVLRLPPDPGKSGGDVDLLVDSADTGRLHAILAPPKKVEGKKQQPPPRPQQSNPPAAQQA